MNILGAIGGTSLVGLRNVVPSGSADVLVKLEGENPTGSIKDRLAHALIARAEKEGRLVPGGTVVACTGGGTGASLALVCAARGYRLRIVTSDAFRRRHRDRMLALGADLALVLSDRGRVTPELLAEMVAIAGRWAAEPGAFYVDHFHNVDAIAAYESLGEEIWSQTRGAVDAIVGGIGSGAALRGMANALRRRRPHVRVVAVAAGAGREHAAGASPPLWDAAAASDVETVDPAEAVGMTRRLARLEGLLATPAGGANVVAALRVAARLGAGATIVTLLPEVACSEAGARWHGVAEVRTVTAGVRA